MAYLLDANVFIEAKNRYYGFEFCPAFWEWLLVQNNEKNVYCIDKVGDEIIAGTDSLAEWAKEHKNSLCLRTDPQTLTAMNKVSEWIMQQQFAPVAQSTFLDSADLYLISFALAHDHTIVTHELHAPTKKRVKIPTVCIGLGIPFKNTFEMLRHEHAMFILEKAD